MSDPFIEQLNEKNLCTWFLLPLLDMSFQVFGESNFVNAYLVENRDMTIAVEVKDKDHCPHIQWTLHYLESIYREGKTYLLFAIPTEWSQDYTKFKEGKYSELSDSAKARIRELSGLRYKFLNDKKEVITDAILLALDKHPVLKNKWFEVLTTGRNDPGPDLTEADFPDELLSIPGPQSFITI